MTRPLCALGAALLVCGLSTSCGDGPDPAVELEAVKLQDIDRSGVLAGPLLPGAPAEARFGVSGAYGGLTTRHAIEQVPAGVSPRAALRNVIGLLKARGVRSDSKPGCNRGTGSWTGLVEVQSSWPGAATWSTRVQVQLVDRSGASVGQVSAPYVAATQVVAGGVAEATVDEVGNTFACDSPPAGS